MDSLTHAQKYYRRNKKKILAAHARWVASHRDHLKRYRFKRYHADPEKHRAKRRSQYHSDLVKSREYSRAYRQAHIEIRRAQDRAAYHSDIKKYRARKRSYYIRDPEKYRARDRAYYHAHRESRILKNQAHYLRNRAMLAATARWRRNTKPRRITSICYYYKNKDQILEQKRRYRRDRASSIAAHLF